MDDYQLLDPTKHASVRIQNQGSLLKLDRGMLAPAFLGEFRSLACEFPIVLTKDGETGQFFALRCWDYRPGTYPALMRAVNGKTPIFHGR